MPGPTADLGQRLPGRAAGHADRSRGPTPEGLRFRPAAGRASAARRATATRTSASRPMSRRRLSLQDFLGGPAHARDAGPGRPPDRPDADRPDRRGRLPQRTPEPRRRSGWAYRWSGSRRCSPSSIASSPPASARATSPSACDCSSSTATATTLRWRPCVDHLDLLARRDFTGLKRICGVDDEDLAEMVAEIRRLDPKPGLRFGGGADPARRA